MQFNNKVLSINYRILQIENRLKMNVVIVCSLMIELKDKIKFLKIKTLFPESQSIKNIKSFNFFLVQHKKLAA